MISSFSPPTSAAGMQETGTQPYGRGRFHQSLTAAKGGQERAGVSRKGVAPSLSEQVASGPF